MLKGDADRWHKLSKDAKTLLRIMANHADTGHIGLNDLRMVVDLQATDSRTIMTLWQELESRAYGHVTDNDGPNPTFVLNVADVQSLKQAHKTDQAPQTFTGEI